jgi:hypothetical protein
MKLSVVMGICAVALVGVACNQELRVRQTDGPRAAAAPPQVETVTYRSLDKMTPQAVPYKRASLILAGTKVGVDVVPTESEGKLALKLMARGEEVMTENYRYDGSAFSFVGSTGESYEPAIPLVTFPFSTSDKKNWKGTIQYGEVSLPCTATIASKPETLNMDGGNYQTVNVTVSLSYNGGGSKSTQRLLKFWFAPKKGMVKRDFGLNSTRQPAPEADKS